MARKIFLLVYPLAQLAMLVAIGFLGYYMYEQGSSKTSLLVVGLFALYAAWRFMDRSKKFFDEVLGADEEPDQSDGEEKEKEDRTREQGRFQKPEEE